MLKWLFASLLIAHYQAYAQASKAELSQYSRSQQWLSYLNMKSGLFSYQSRVRRESVFFVSVDGFKNPLSELEESLQIFTNPESFLKRNLGHPQCLFPARYKILQRDLKISTPSVTCPALAMWKKQFHATSVSIMFASQFISNPASIMGHTFLKFNNPQKPEFMNLSVGYAAEMEKDVGPFSYAYNGLLGGFKGTFSVFPYHEKFHEYSNMENRSLWEYQLRLTQEEVEFLLDTIWELKNTAQIDYFFATDNCSYALAFALQTVKPEKNLVEGFGPYVAPYVTLLRLEREGLIASEKLYPSLRTKVMTQYSLLSTVEKNLLWRTLNKKSLSPELSTKNLDLLLDYTSLQRQKNEGFLPEDLVMLEKETLFARSQLGTIESSINYEESSPLASHKPRSFTLGYLTNKNSLQTNVLGFRSGIHSSMDSELGFLSNSAFNFLEIELLYEHSKNKTYLKNFKLIEVQNSPALHPLAPLLSWSFLAEQRLDLISFCNTCTVTSLRPGAGISLDIAKSFSVSTLIEVDYESGKHLPLSDRLWSRLDLTVVLKANPRIKFLQKGIYGYDLLHTETFPYISSESLLRLNITKQLDLGLELHRYHFFKKQPDFWQTKIGFVQHF
jgi:hypothetical protein